MFFYSPKNHIKELWEEIYDFMFKIREWEIKTHDIPYFSDSFGLQSKIEKRKKLINALIDYYFDPEEDEDKEYIQENRP